VKLGYRVWYDQNEMGYDIALSMKDGINKSEVIIICANNLYQSRPNCMFELREAVKNDKKIIALFIEENPFVWANDELKTLAKIDTNMFVDLSEIAKLDWDNNNNISNDNDDNEMEEAIKKLKGDLQVLVTLLSELGCYPQFNHK
jgi:pullulanase/glycogen debranching enzyme